MATSADAEENVTGAVIFISYIIAALILTGILTWDLARAYSSWNASLREQKWQGKTPSTKAPKQTKVHALAAVAVLSFAILSYHMLNFLIQSYKGWMPQVLAQSESLTSKSHGIYQGFRQILEIELWKWSKESTLFQDFAEVICNDPRRFWWTQLVLIYSLAWNIYMSIEGARLQIPHLWAYFLLDQILPVSFTQNLFLLAVALQEKSSHESQLSPAGPGSQILVVAAYFGSLLAAPEVVNTTWFLLILLTARSLLFAPFLLLQPSQQTGMHIAMHSTHWLGRGYKWSAISIIIGGSMLQVAQTVKLLPELLPWTALNDDPAVSALGYDLLIGGFGLLLWNIT